MMVSTNSLTSSRFYLNTGEDFQLFHDAATRNLEESEWRGALPEEELEEAAQE